MARSERERELCAKCGYTYAGHVSNTGVIYPCWTPSGTYKPDAAVTPPASAGREEAGVPGETYSCLLCGQTTPLPHVCPEFVIGGKGK